MNKINWNFPQYFSCNNLFLYPWYLNCLFNNLINGFFYFNIDVFDDLHLFYLLLDYWDMDYLLNLTDYLTYHLFLNNLLHYLRHFNYLLNYSRNNNYFLYDLLNFNNLRYFYHFLNDLFYYNPHLFNPINYGGNFYYFLFNILHHFGNIHINIDIFNYFKDSRLLDNKRLSNNDLFDVNWLYPRNNRLFNNNLLDYCHLSNNWDLDKSIHLLNHLSNDLNQSCLNCWYFFNNFLDYDSFSYYFNFFNLCNYVIDLLYHLDLLWYLFDSLFYLDYWNYLLYDAIHYLILYFNVVFNLSSTTILYYWHNLLYDLLNFNNLGNFNHSFYDFLHKNRYFYNFLHNFLDWHKFLNNDFNLLVLSLNMIDYSLNLNCLLNFHYSLFNHFDFHDFSYFFFNLNKFLNNSWYLNNSLYFIFVWY